MNFQWYPGHMTKAKRQMLEDIKLIDLVIELIDARIPFSSRNPDIDNIARNKARLVLLNKSDMADEEKTAEWKDYFINKGFHVCVINSLNRGDMKQINDVVRAACTEKIERDRKRGIRNRPVRAMVVGIPNVGKSTFINSFAGKGAARTGNKPGVTKGKQWIKLSQTLELLDTPGILWPKFEDQLTGLKLALIGSIKDEIINIEELSLELIKMIGSLYPDALYSFYGIQADGNEDPAHVLERIAVQRGCLSKGGGTDYLRAAGLILENFRNGRIGRFTLERPEDI
ncbi:MAG: ribosome biogenesis GTPase YlqF [Parasporobacterium sp.]|nr:ribosome biogenesis GTPase YlqF [Parasporobacterium sp.]